jgi:hypothetical protein
MQTAASSQLNIPKSFCRAKKSDPLIIEPSRSETFENGSIPAASAISLSSWQLHHRSQMPELVR